jgi:tetratricopeptide (TPR) repeat protein
LDGDSAYVHRAQAEIFSEAQQPDKAIVEYQAAIKTSPTNAELYEALGNEEQRVSHPTEAAAAYQAELSINPNSAVALYNLGKIQVEIGDTAQGVALLQRAVAAHAVAAPTYFYLGFGLAKLDKSEEAAGWLEKALSSSPSDLIRQRAEYELVRVYQKLGRKEDSQRALDELKRLKAQPVQTSEPH